MPGRWGYGAIVGCTVLSLAGCSSVGSQPAAADTSGIPIPALAQPTTATPAPVDKPPAGEPNPSPPPSTTAGLTQASLPAPTLLGKGWSYRVDAGGPEAGYSGNGTPSMARNPAEVAAGIWPLGCIPPNPLPALPSAALEVDYQRSGPSSVGVALLLKFSSSSKATAFFTAYSGTVRACSTSAAGGAPQITLVTRPDPIQFGSIRRDAPSDPANPVWTEGLAHKGNFVLLVTVATSEAAVGSPWKALD